MTTLEELIRLETASSGIAFRERAYGAVERQGLLRDLIGMANAEAAGRRVIFMGVRDVVGGERKLVGVTGEAVAEARRLCQALVTRLIEPPLAVRIQTLGVDGVMIAALLLEQCDDPPYLLKRSVSNAMRTGNGWIRKGTVTSRLSRADLQRVFEAKFGGARGSADVQVGFPGRVPLPEVALPVMELDEMPSELAGDRLRGMLEAKSATREIFGRTVTQMERLAHAKIFGGDQPYEAHSSSSLVKRLERTAQEHEAADRYYEFEIRAHKLNISLANVGDADVRGATLVLDLPRIDGVGVVEHPCQTPGSPPNQLEGYPIVDPGPRMVRIQAGVGEIRRGETVDAFAQPLRVCCRTSAAGKTLPVDYALHGTGLREPITGTLRIHVVEATRRVAARQKKPVTRATGNG